MQINSHSFSKMAHLQIIIGTIIILVIVIGFIRWSSEKWDKTFRAPMLLKECPPEEIVKEIKYTCGIELPKSAYKMHAAKNIGSWDSSEEDFVFKFNVSADQIANFIKSLPSDNVPKEFKNENDMRSTKNIGQPLWFLAPIPKGVVIEGCKIREYKGIIEYIYIDTSNSDESIVYVLGVLRK